MRVIEHGPSQIKRSEDAPVGEGVLHFVDERGSAAIVDGRLYIDGQPAPAGQHRMHMADGDVVVTVSTKGKASHRVEKRQGGGPVG